MVKRVPAKRKGWSQLSPAYRKRLERGGITAKKYNSGASLHKARGKVSAQHENQQQRFWRIADRAGFDRDDVREVVDAIGFEEANTILTYRDEALKGDNPFSSGAMRVLYGQYAEIVPKEWLYYHGGAK